MLVNKISYALSEISENYQDTYWWRQRLENRVIGPIQQKITQPGINMMAEEWDNLLILDACRADLFEETVDFDKIDDYKRVRSPASCTPEWLENHFTNEEYGDTVYISGNPWVSKIAPNAFHELVNIWLDEYDIVEEELQDAQGLADLGISFGATVPADRVNKATLDIHKQYNDKRYIVHYFQPHAPYVGNPDGTLKTPEEVTQMHPGRELKDGVFKREDVWGEYKQNLEYVFHHAWNLAKQLDGRTVITADHGELFGERLFPIPIRGYAHPRGLRASELSEVPWAVIDGSRREVTDEGASRSKVNETEIEERLSELGYK